MRRSAAALVLRAPNVLPASFVACGGGLGGPETPSSAAGRIGVRKQSPIKHVVVVIQENRSFDNFFATFPGADGTTTGKAAAMSTSVA